MEKIPKYLSIGSRIQQIRAKEGLSQKRFAEKIGISSQMLSVLERGEVKPTIPTLLAIEYVYKFRMAWILTGDEPIYVERFSQPVIPLVEYKAPQRLLLFWVDKLIRIFNEGDKGKIKAVKAQLRAFDPGPAFKEPEEEEAAQAPRPAPKNRRAAG